MHTSIVEALSSVFPCLEVGIKNLVMFPLLRRDARPPDAARQSNPGSFLPSYVVLDDALAQGAVEITEVSEQGSVPELRVVNRGSDPVLILDGEELVGAKQNRVVNLTILVAAQSELIIPVSCVEAGRWRARSTAFAAAPRTQYATGRAKRMSQVTGSMTTAGLRVSDQSEVWADIADKSARLNTSSPTGAMSALFANHGEFIDECVSACTAVEDQVGALFAVDGRIVGMDLFESSEIFRKLLPKLVRGVAVDALDHAQFAEGNSKQSGRSG